MTKRILIVLAKSYKRGGRCIAGKTAVLNGPGRLDVADWFRPVPEDGMGAISEESLTFSNGDPLRVLDVVELVSLGRVCVPGQPENEQYDQNVPWRHLGRFHAENIGTLIDSPGDIWFEANQPTNRISAEYDRTINMSNSLYLIKPENFLITLGNNYDSYNAKFKKTITASFNYKGVHYQDFSITCPSTRRILKNQYPEEGGEEKTLPLRKGDNYYLCVSLTPRFGSGNFHYKLVATVFDFDGYLQRTYPA